MLPKSFGQKSKGSTADKSTKSSDTDWDALRAFMPTSFGKQQKKNDVTEEFEKTKREDAAVAETKRARVENKDGETKAVKTSTTKEGDEEYDSANDMDSNSDGEGNVDFSVLPTSHEIKLADHARTVSALALILREPDLLLEVTTMI
ncbi:unnamed protein product [Mucor hiemalis]